MTDWFRAEAAELPPSDLKQAVLSALENTHPSHMGIELTRLDRQGLLPPSWHEALEIYWSNAR